LVYNFVKEGYFTHFLREASSVSYFLVLIQESSKEDQAQMSLGPLWSKRSMAGRVSQIVGRGFFYYLSMLEWLCFFCVGLLSCQRFETTSAPAAILTVLTIHCPRSSAHWCTPRRT